METEIKGKEYTLSAAKANAQALYFILPILAVSLIPYFLIHGAPGMSIGTISLLPAFLIGIVVHELIHGLCWGLFAKSGFKSIRFGVIWSALTPYCHCKEALTIRQYRIGGLMPTVVLGFIPVIYAWITGNNFALIFGTLLTIGGSGDFIILWMMRKLPADLKVKDHPSKCGFYLPEEE